MEVAEQSEPGNIDLRVRPRVKNPDGTTSTIRSMSFEEDGREVLVPTVVDGRVVSDDAAIEHYRKTGQHLGKFSTVKEANAFGKRLHEDEAAGRGSKAPTDSQSSSVPDGWQIVPPTSAAAPPASRGHDFKILGVNIHVPGEEKPRADSNMIGWGENGAGIAPEDALMGGQATRAVAGAVRAGGAVKGAAEAVYQAAPMVKYELTKSALEKMGVPAPLAMAAALAVSGYKKDAKPGPAGRPSNVAPAGVETAQEALARKTATVAPSAASAPVAVSPSPQATPAAPSAQSVAPPPSGESLPSPRPANNLPDQKALNEAALARRRAEYQASAARTPAPAAKPTLLASEAKEYLRLIQSGKSAKDAMASIEMQRALNAQLGLGTPSSADTKFPKGQRGALPK